MNANETTPRQTTPDQLQAGDRVAYGSQELRLVQTPHLEADGWCALVEIAGPRRTGQRWFHIFPATVEQTR